MIPKSGKNSTSFLVEDESRKNMSGKEETERLSPRRHGDSLSRFYITHNTLVHLKYRRMGDSGQKPKLPPALPQLARKCYNIDSSSNDESTEYDSDSDSLLILSPVQKKKPLYPSRTENSPMIGNKYSSVKTLLPKKPPPTAIATGAAKTSKTSKSNSLDFSIPSDSDSDEDDFLFTSKRVFEISKQPRRPSAKLKAKPDTEKQRKKRELQALKEKEKQERAQKRKEAKEVKEQQKQQEKRQKKQQSEQINQATGKYSHEEIAILFDSDMYKADSHGLVDALSTDFLVHPYRNRIAQGLSATTSLIQFIRKEKLLGGAKHAVECLESERSRYKKSNCDGKNEGYEHIHYLVALFEPDDFIPLLYRDSQDEDDDYPALESWLEDIRSRWLRAWPSAAVEPKIIFLLSGLPEALDKMWINYRRQNRNSSRNGGSLPTVRELQDAMQWVLIQFQVECIFCPNDEFLQSTVHKMTRGLADKPYVNQVTELECIKKIKQGCAGSNDPLEKARDVWLRQLQQVPGLSENKAQHLAEHFPTCQSLWQAYQWEHYCEQEQDYDRDDANARCSSLLDDKFSADNKRYKKLSDSLYRVLTSDDPYEMIL